jgi:tRNA threonylcarbamoyl adenosine modification protein (Sua5/YciO/YrdC/YwlC family)
VVLPTDTVYGVAARPDVPGAVEAIFRVKARAQEKPLPILGADLDTLAAVAAFDERARALAARFWPGALTMVLPRASDWRHHLGGSDDGTVAVRVPDSAMTRLLLERSGPLAVTSANISGDAPATSVDAARSALGDAVAVYLDGGRCGGLASTVVSLVGEPEILRTGGIDATELADLLQGRTR